jgi:type II secretory pathway component PulJ
MGSSTMLDVIGSFFIGGILMLMALRLNASGMETSAVYNSNLILQQNLTTLVRIIEEDFRKIGYCRDWKKIPDPSKSIRVADSSRFRFWTDVDNNGTLDSITYFIGPTSELLDTPNPRDRFLYRQVNNTAAMRMNLGVTQFSLRYRDAENDPISFPVTDPRLVYFMEINVAVETPAPLQQEFVSDTTQYEAYWRQIRLLTKNLRNR